MTTSVLARGRALREVGSVAPGLAVGAGALTAVALDGTPIVCAALVAVVLAICQQAIP